MTDSRPAAAEVIAMLLVVAFIACTWHFRPRDFGGRRGYRRPPCIDSVPWRHHPGLPV